MCEMREIKTQMRRQNRLYKKWRRNGFKTVKVKVDKLRDYCDQAINNAKQIYLRDLGTKLILKSTGRTIYWHIL